MGWHAKPSGGYSLPDQDAIDNIQAIDSYMSGYGYTKEAISAMCGNIMAEGGLNPWRYQRDLLTGAGYGLFQYTPKNDYLNLTGIPDFAPNRSTTTITPGASPNDGNAQLYVFANDTLGKWTTSCWRSYWSTTTYAELYAKTRQILNTWGDGSRLTLDDFSHITSIEDATIAFLACFEGPQVPNYVPRVENAVEASVYVSGGSSINPGILLLLLSRRLKK